MHIILRPAAQFVALAGMKQAQLNSRVDDVDNCKCGVAPGAGSGLDLIRYGPSCNRHPLAPLDPHNHDGYTLKMSPNIINAGPPHHIKGDTKRLVQKSFVRIVAN